MFSPEFVSLYLMIGLGVSMVGLTSTKNKEFLPYKDFPRNLAHVIVKIPLGFVVSAFILLFWPTYVTVGIMRKLK